MDLSQFRREYLLGGLSRKDLEPDPQKQFSLWFEQARKTNIADPIYLIGYVFLAGAKPKPPFPVPGSDPTPDALIHCVTR